MSKRDKARLDWLDEVYQGSVVSFNAHNPHLPNYHGKDICIFTIPTQHVYAVGGIRQAIDAAMREDKSK